VTKTFRPRKDPPVIITSDPGCGSAETSTVSLSRTSDRNSGNHSIRNRCHLLAEVDNAGDSRERADLTSALEIFEPRKEVTGEECFGRPDRLTRSHPAKTNAGSENFEPNLAL
jgi:hypothetical protein